MYSITWKTKAIRQAKKIKDRTIRNKIYEEVQKPKKWPIQKLNIKNLKDRDGYRLRVGNWRVVFDVHHEIKIIEIEEVKKRNERTY